MTTQEIIKQLCESRGSTVSALEQKLGYANGSLKKAGSIKSDRLLEIANEFGVSMEYLMGTNEPGLDSDMSILQRERNKMNSAEKEKLMRILAANFDDYNWDSDDSGNFD